MSLPRLKLALAAVVAALVAIPAARAATYALPPPGSNMVGEPRVIRIANDQVTLLDVARRYDLGYDEIVRANPSVPVWVPKPGMRIVLPMEFVLPPVPWQGIVVNIPQRRLFYFPPARRGAARIVITFPISTARPGWKTPLGATRIIAKEKDPSWIVPASIRAEHEQDGETDFPAYFPPGPDNPMGMLALETGFPMIFIHGTNKPWGVGMRTSHGCIHLYPEDAETLFPQVAVGTPVRFIDEPDLVGVRDGRPYLSAWPTVAEYPADLPPASRAVGSLIRIGNGAKVGKADIDWQRMIAAAGRERGIPVPIGPRAPELDQVLAELVPVSDPRGPYGADANNAAPPLPVE